MEGDQHPSSQGKRLIVASVALFASSLLWVLSVVLNFIGPAGPITAGVLAWTAMGLDLLGALLLAWIFHGLARGAAGATRWRRNGIALGFLIWTGLTAYWRFILPAVAQINVVDLFAGLLGADPSGLALARTSATVVAELFGLWLGASVLFALIQAVVALDYRRAPEEEWVRGLPAYAWLVGALISLAGTAAVVLGLLPVLSGGVPDSSVTVGAVLKLLVAPNVFLSGYVASLQLGWVLVRGERPAVTT